ncbi:hypothetical protein F5Y18DRAFT_443638 [Xylariaceae sp. FL1019]|nr:hypothetical protein F5Y18DRAFT_443638 [Xylariaceae sp. FL1019]
MCHYQLVHTTPHHELIGLDAAERRNHVCAYKYPDYKGDKCPRHSCCRLTMELVKSCRQGEGAVPKLGNGGGEGSEASVDDEEVEGENGELQSGEKHRKGNVDEREEVEENAVDEDDDDLVVELGLDDDESVLSTNENDEQDLRQEIDQWTTLDLGSSDGVCGDAYIEQVFVPFEVDESYLLERNDRAGRKDEGKSGEAESEADGVVESVKQRGGRKSRGCCGWLGWWW